jgi:hypothetical protein
MWIFKMGDRKVSKKVKGTPLFSHSARSKLVAADQALAHRCKSELLRWQEHSQKRKVMEMVLLTG